MARENPRALGPGELQCILGFLNCSCCIRPDLYSVNGSHDPSALTSESDFLWHTQSGWLLRWAYWWGLVVPKKKRGRDRGVLPFLSAPAKSCWSGSLYDAKSSSGPGKEAGHSALSQQPQLPQWYLPVNPTIQIVNQWEWDYERDYG